MGRNKALINYYAQEEELAFKLVEQMKKGGNLTALQEEYRSLKKNGEEATLKNVLSAEQLQTYRAEKREQSQRLIESNARKVLTDMQANVEIKEEQQDAIIKVIVEGNYKQSIPINLARIGAADEAQSLVEERRTENEALLRDLKPVLNQRQLADYQVFLEREVENLEGAIESARRNLNPSEESGLIPVEGDR